ncbi:MAG: hypothetical protein UZ11_BCD004000773 [Bacteroidetes bacterium OLB11]|nr:MAG: hypothetical protein UZ11_BCD004000773 [Bacteroidetes bacterium OLB11]
MKTKLIILSCLVIFLFFHVRKNAPPPNPNEEEFITTLQLEFIDSSGASPSIYALYQDKDGDGGNQPDKWDSIKLKSNTCYYMSITLLDETKTPSDTVSNEIISEGHDHLFCFDVLGLNLSINKIDLDKNGLPIGMKTKWNTGQPGNGSVQVILKHQPDIKTGDCNIGATDIQLTFQLRVE